MVTEKIWTPKIIVPSVIDRDARMRAARLALEEQLSRLSMAAREALFLPRLDELDEPILDILAAQFHVDFYDGLPLTVELKRELIRQSIMDHRRKGTADAVEALTRRIFRTALVEEWYEYGGLPYFFRMQMDVTSDDEDASSTYMNLLRRAVAETKNERSWLDYYLATMDAESEVDAPREAQRYELDFMRGDEYDYRREIHRHDGVDDYGLRRSARYGDKLTFDGADVYGGFSARINYGQLQASDFEIFRVWMELAFSEGVEMPSDVVFATVYLRPLVERCDLDEKASVFEVEQAASSTIVAGESRLAEALVSTSEAKIVVIEDPMVEADLPSKEVIGSPSESRSLTGVIETEETIASEDTRAFEAEVAPLEETIAPVEGGLFGAHQGITANGTYTYNGEIMYDGDHDAAIQLIDAEQDARWSALLEHLIDVFDEACPECGLHQYQFEHGRVRFGTEHPMVDDIRIPSVVIKCSKCGALIAEYLVEEPNYTIMREGRQ